MTEPSTSPHQNTTTATTTATNTATSLSWGTLEELLLACAVHRYGTNSWDSIARELQNRTTFSLLTPHICQQRYIDLKKRFASNDRNSAAETSDDDTAFWLDELRRRRVAELRRDLQRYDHSIVSLQLKVKKLKEEREKEEIEDLDEKKKVKEEEKEMNMEDEPPGQSEPDPVEPVKDEPAGESCNGSSNSKEGLRRDRVDSAELGAESKDEGGCERDEGVKENSDVQSTASLWRTEINDNNNNNNNNSNNNNNNKVNNNNKKIYDRREKKVGGINSGTSSGEENQSSPFKGNDDGKLQPLIEFLEIVRARKLALYFQRRLKSQETPKYTNLIKQHIDLETIQRNLEEGQYTDCHTKFYRDFTLLVNNALIFFNKRSSEHKSALELCQLLKKQFHSHLSSPLDLKSHLSKPALPVPLSKPVKPDPTDLKPKLTITGPVIACRKRSSITGKSSRLGSERKELISVTPPSSEKPLALELKNQVEKVSSIAKKRSREQSFGSRSSSSKNNKSNLIPKTPVNSGKVETSETKGDRKKPNSGSSSHKLKDWLGSGKNKLLESLKNSDKRKTTSDSSSGSGSGKSERRKDEASLSKLVKEKAKEKVERESSGNNRAPSKRVASLVASKRGRNGGGESEPQSRKRQRK